jgi:hypothetical protein
MELSSVQIFRGFREAVASGGTITWSVPLGALALLAFSIMLVEGAIADWSAIYLRTSVLTGPG